jgi:hydrogenase maturation factor
MLIAISEDKAAALLAALNKNYPHARVIGRVQPPAPCSIIVNGGG